MVGMVPSWTTWRGHPVASVMKAYVVSRKGHQVADRCVGQRTLNSSGVRQGGTQYWNGTLGKKSDCRHQLLPAPTG